jgi:hypothetical protein
MNRDLPPPNRAIGWYRFMLWMMPTCIAITTLFGIAWLASVVQIHTDFWVIVWFIFNILATLGIGYFEVKLRNSDPSRSIETRTGVARFFMQQFLIIPALSFALLFAACLFAG